MAGGTCMTGGMHDGGGDAWLRGRMHDRGHSWWGGMLEW